jgi:AcrR family transcriptional regulator
MHKGNKSVHLRSGLPTLVPERASERPDTRTALLDAAERLLAHYGYRKMTMDDLAQEAGLARRTIYLHFKSKEEVALATIDRTIDCLLAELRAVAASEPSPPGAIHAMLVRRILFLFDRFQNVRHTLDDVYAALRQQYKEHRERYVRAEAALFARVLSEGERLGAFQIDDPDATACALVLATSTLTPFSLNRAELGDRADLERRIVKIADLLVYGLMRGRDSRDPCGR